MKNFDSLAKFGMHLLEVEAGAVLAMKAGMHTIAQKVEDTAKAEIGHYQPAVGPFQDWAPLADATEDEKARLGYPLDAPLLREGALRESITHEVHGLEAIVGSASPVAAFQEFGTSTIPPRPFIGPAAFHNKEAIKAIAGGAAVSGLTGGQVIHPALGYDLIGS